jgi:putative transposase
LKIPNLFFKGLGMTHSCVEIYLHLIFSTKGRLSLIPKNIENRLYGYLSGIAKKSNIIVLAINGTSDHLHLLIKLNATTSVGKLIQELKSYSSGWMKKQGIMAFTWQEGYGAFSCSITHIKPLIKYIENQKEHHKVISFEDEIEKLNKLWKTKWKIDNFEESESSEESENSRD